jgi:hypothetical protein
MYKIQISGKPSFPTTSLSKLTVLFLQPTKSSRHPYNTVTYGLKCITAMTMILGA